MRRWLITTGLCSLLSSACSGVGNTGNPGTTEEDPTPPEGVTFLRSQLPRDTAPGLGDADTRQFGEDQDALTGALFEQLSGDSPNLFFSPYSIATALAMLYGGAEGDTKREMAEALSFHLPEPTLHAAFNASDLALAGRADEVDPKQSGEGFELRSTNAQFAEKSYEFKPTYLDLLAQHYGSGLFLADFVAAPERERKAINAWVSERTRERIDQLLPPMSIDSSTVLVLVNAIYFKGSWLQRFDPGQTEDAAFQAPNASATVRMMHKTNDSLYMQGDGYQAVELPYVSDAVRMLLILPDAGQQAAIEGRLKEGLVADARAGLAVHRVDLRLPRFSFSSDLDLIPSLQALGMARVFADADLSGIGGAPGELFVSGVFHQAFVGVDEQGTEAAAATAVVVSRTSAGEPVSVTFDRPFLFFIYDEPTGAMLFAGRFSGP